MRTVLAAIGRALLVALGAVTAFWRFVP